MKAVVLNGPKRLCCSRRLSEAADRPGRYAVGDEEDSDLWHRYKDP